MTNTGVYCIENSITGRCYVGASRGMLRRWDGHKSDLRRGTHPCASLQHDWERLGEGAFEFRVLENVDLNDLEICEGKWIQHYSQQPPGVYNARLVPTKISVSVNPRSLMALRLTDEARELLEALAERRGVSKASVLEWIIREKAEELGIKRGEKEER